MGMKVVILAGGLGSRLWEETTRRPKPLVTIAGRPILWHVMMSYAIAGFRDFVVATGYMGEMIERYFVNLKAGVAPGAEEARDWRVSVVDTGPQTSTGGRIRRLGHLLDRDTFMLAWSDGLANVDPRTALAFHRAHGRLATITAVHPPPRFGRLALDGDRVTGYMEKPVDHNDWISGGLFVLEPQVLGYISGDHTEWEREPLDRLTRENQIMAFRHEGFWQCMDTAADRDRLETLWRSGGAPWRTW